jgi:hypothetical protein
MAEEHRVTTSPETGIRCGSRLARIAIFAAASLVPLVACGGDDATSADSSNDVDSGRVSAGGDSGKADGGVDGGKGGKDGGGALDGSTGGIDSSTAGGHDASSGNDGGPPVNAVKKRGLAYGHNSDADLAALSSGVAWWYNWAPSPDTGLAPAHAGVEYVPMIWGGDFDPNTLATQVPAGAKYLLTFNEPNFGAQSNLTPTQAAALWPKIEAFAKSKNLAIVSPALNYCGGSCNETSPFDWLDKFFTACPNCKVDYIGAHWYACTKSALASYIQQYETKYKKPIWLTEFSCLDDPTITEAKEEAYMKDAVAFLEGDPMVFRYAWFTGRFAQQPAIDLLGGSGVLTPLGKQYVSLPSGP